MNKYRDIGKRTVEFIQIGEIYHCLASLVHGRVETCGGVICDERDDVQVWYLESGSPGDVLGFG